MYNPNPFERNSSRRNSLNVDNIQFSNSRSNSQTSSRSNSRRNSVEQPNFLDFFSLESKSNSKPNSRRNSQADLLGIQDYLVEEKTHSRSNSRSNSRRNSMDSINLPPPYNSPNSSYDSATLSRGSTTLSKSPKSSKSTKSTNQQPLNHSNPLNPLNFPVGPANPFSNSRTNSEYYHYGQNQHNRDPNAVVFEHAYPILKKPKQPAKLYDWVVCPLCDKKLRQSQFDGHLQKFHY